ncbi:MAG: hypothetical protein J7L66_01800 [Anaerolineaceae bacterium]|nr:hypothetical protein [Anaerolineaceae bacterium]
MEASREIPTSIPARTISWLQASQTTPIRYRTFPQLLKWHLSYPGVSAKQALSTTQQTSNFHFFPINTPRKLMKGGLPIHEPHKTISL